VEDRAVPVARADSELKNQLSGYLDRVKAGAEITVTEHGRPIARLTSVGPESGFVVGAEIGYAEARAALASAGRTARVKRESVSIGRAELDTLWAQLDVVPGTTEVVLAAAALAEAEGLRGYDAVHLAAAMAAKVTVVASDHERALVSCGRHCRPQGIEGSAAAETSPTWRIWQVLLSCTASRPL
jgi:prevent-host-death family protein